MNAEERDLIAGLFARMRDMRGIDKDRDAADLIEREAAANPDAVYLLTQTVLVQEQALQAANARIQDLEAGLPAGSSAPTATPSAAAATGAPRRSAGFGAAAGASVPASGARSASFGGSASVPPSGPNVSKPYAPAARNTPNERPAGGGSFMSQAMSTAVGVAGGMLLAGGISSLLGGSAATAAPATDPAASSEPNADAAANAEQPADPAADQGGLEDASADAGGEDGGWFGGLGDWGDFGGDVEL